MSDFQETLAAVSEHSGKVAVAAAATGAVFGLDLGPLSDTTAESAVELATLAFDAYVGVSVVVAKVRSAVVEAFKDDDDIDTGPTTPGPVDYDEEHVAESEYEFIDDDEPVE